jgi:glycosyltransferase involved in cell wall biosynthesis
MSATKFSVIVPHLNQPDHLKRCLLSLSQQTYDLHQFEIIVVDNGSKSMPESICNEFDNVRLLSELSPGPGPARNKGVAAARNELLAFIDADCIADPDWLSAAKGVLTKPGTLVIGGDVRIAYDDPNKLTALEAYESVFAYQQKKYIEKKSFTGTGNMALHLEVMKKVGPFRGIEVAEDRDWGYRAQQLNIRIQYVPSMIVRHPARKTFCELKSKWDRHISHDFEERGATLKGKLIWALTAILIAISPFWGWIEIAASPNLAIWKDKLRAFAVFSRVRFYRAGQMFKLLSLKKRQSRSKLWNRHE